MAKTQVASYLLRLFPNFYHFLLTVEESTESVEHPMHEAAKRGNLNYFIIFIKNPTIFKIALR